MENKEKMPEWDLSEYYNGVDDPKIGEDLNAYADKAAAFAAKYRGKVAGLDGVCCGLERTGRNEPYCIQTRRVCEP